MITRDFTRTSEPYADMSGPDLEGCFKEFLRSNQPAPVDLLTALTESGYHLSRLENALRVEIERGK